MHSTLSEKLNENAEWLVFYEQVKNGSSYKFMYSDMDSYVGKVTRIVNGNFHESSIAVKQSDHNIMLQELKVNFLKLIDDINMLDLSNLAICIQYVFDKMLDCLQVYYTSLAGCIKALGQETGMNHTRYIYQSKCSECHRNTQRNKVESMINSMTLANHRPNLSQTSKIAHEIEEIPKNSDDIELSILIDQILQRKEAILGSQNQKINNIYDEIAHYLENIPQATYNMSKQSSIKSSIVDYQVANFSEGIEKNFEDMLKWPIKKLIKRVLEYARSIYCKNKESATIQTQTLLIKDEENIKMLLNSNENLKKELNAMRKLKRESQKQIVKMLDFEQKNQIRVSELTTEKNFLEQKIERITSEFMIVKQKLQLSQASKKELSEKLVKDYTNQRSIFIKTIKQLELKIETISFELMRLKKQAHANMMSVYIQTDFVVVVNAENQGEFKQTFTEGNYQMSKSRSKIKLGTSSIAEQAFTDTPDLESPNQSQIIQKKIMKNKMIKAQHRKSLLRTKPENFFFSPEATSNFHAETAKRSKKIELPNEKDSHYKQKKHHDDNYFLKPPQIQRSKRPKLTEIARNTFQALDNISQKSLRVHSKSSRSKRVGCQDDDKYLHQSLMNGKLKVESSRMFNPRSHGNPYIGSHPFISNGNGFNTWLNAIQVNTLKNNVNRENQNKQNQNQKGIFVSKIMEKFLMLKENGLLAKINEIIDSKNEEHAKEIIRNLKQEKISNKEIISPRQSKFSNKMININELKALNVKGKNQILKTSKIGQNLLFRNSADSEEEFFGRKEIFLLFGTFENAKKYENGQDIWGTLQNSIMLDNNFMGLCDSIEIFLGQLKSTKPEFYYKLSQVIANPTKCLSKLGIKDGNLGQRKKLYQKHSATLSSNIEIIRKSKQSEIKSAHDLRVLFHRILRFHKIQHKKCNHVDEFLEIIDFQIQKVNTSPKRK